MQRRTPQKGEDNLISGERKREGNGEKGGV